MYAFKAAFTLGVPVAAIYQLFPIDYALSENLKLMFNAKDLSLARCLSIIRGTVLRNYNDHYKNSPNLVNKILPNATTITQERIDEVLKLSGEMIDLGEIYSTMGVHGFLNYLNDWFEENIEEILYNNDIPYPNIIKPLFKYPHLDSRSIKDFIANRVKSINNPYKVIIPRSKLKKRDILDFFDSDESFYFTVIKIEPSLKNVKIPKGEIKGNKFFWEGDTRYITIKPGVMSTATVADILEERENIIKNAEASSPTTISASNQEPETALNSTIQTEFQELEPQPTELSNITEPDNTLEHRPPSLTNYDNNFKECNDAVRKLENTILDNRKNEIEWFIGAKKLLIAVDCDNTNFYNFTYFLEHCLKNAQIGCIMLFIDPKSCNIWSADTLKLIVNIPESTEVCEHIVTRLKDEKSMVDVRLCTGVCRKLYAEKYKRIIVASSDSDYLAMIDIIRSFNDIVKFAVSYETDFVSWKYLSELDKRNVTIIPMARYRNTETLENRVEHSIKHTLAGTLKKTPLTIFNKEKFVINLVKLFEKSYIDIYNPDKLEKYITSLLNKAVISFTGAENSVRITIDDMVI